MIIEKPYWITGFGALLSIHVHPDGTRFVTAGADSVVRVWSLNVLSTNRRPSSTALAHKDKLALLEKRSQQSSTAPAGATDDPSAAPVAAAAAAGDEVAADSDGEEDEEPPEHPDGCLLATLGRHEKGVNVARWSPDGKFLATGSDDQAVILWALKVSPGVCMSFWCQSRRCGMEAECGVLVMFALV